MILTFAYGGISDPKARSSMTRPVVGFDWRSKPVLDYSADWVNFNPATNEVQVDTVKAAAAGIEITVNQATGLVTIDDDPDVA